MAQYTPVHDPAFECVKDIVRLLQARLRPEARIMVNWFVRDQLHFISCRPLVSSPKEANDITIEIERGIPKAALVPERIGPIAYGLVVYFRKRQPNWFLPNDIVPLSQA